jgi:TonB family protein
MTSILFVAALVLVASSAPTPVPPPRSTGMEKGASAALPRGAVPLGNPGQWIRPDDYPSTAVLDQSEGAVSFELKVDPQGRVSQCVVTISSGVATLDDTACNLITQRAVFDPARDKKGKAVWGTYSSRVVWKMNDPTPPPQPMQTMSSFIVETDGSVTDCVMTATGISPEQVEKAKGSCERSRFEPYVDENGTPVRRRFRMTMKVDVEPVE